MGARHGGEVGGTLQADRDMAALGNASRSRPGPQPRSRIVNGGSPSIACNSAATFWLTS
jgi:hypothetical protein